MSSIPLPRVSQQVPGAVAPVAPNAAPMQDATPAHLQQTGQAMQSVGTAVTSIAHTLQDEADDARIKEGDLAFAAALDDEVRNFRQKQGGDAADGAKKEHLDAMEKAMVRIETTMRNSLQKSKFRDAAGWRMLRARQQIEDHEAEQTRVWALGRASAKADRHQLDARRAYVEDMDPVEYLAQLDLMDGELRTIGRITGLPEEAVQQAILAKRSELHDGVLGDLLGMGTPGAAADARAYLERARGEMSPDKVADREADLQLLDDRIGGAHLAQLMLRGAADQLPGDPARQEALVLDSIRASDRSTKQREIAEATVKKHFESQRRMEAELREQVVKDFTARFTPRRDIPPEQQRAIRALPYESMVSVEEQRLIDRLGLTDRVRQMFEGDMRSDRQALMLSKQLTTEQLRNTPRERLQNTFGGLLSQPAMEELETRWRAANGFMTPHEAARLSDKQIVVEYFGRDANGVSTFDTLDETEQAWIMGNTIKAWNDASATTYDAKRKVLDELKFKDAVKVEKRMLGMDWMASDEDATFMMLPPERRKDAYVVSMFTGQPIPVGLPEADAIAEVRTYVRELVEQRLLGADDNTTVFSVWDQLGRGRTVGQVREQINRARGVAAPLPGGLMGGWQIAIPPPRRR